MLRDLATSIPKETILALSKIQPGQGSALVKANICFMVFQIRDDVLEDIPVYLKRALEVVYTFEGVPIDGVSSMLVVAFGSPIHSPRDTDVDRRDKAVIRLLEDLGSNIRIVSARADALVGNLGDRNLHYGAAIPNFAVIMETLLKLSFGKSTTL